MYNMKHMCFTVTYYAYVCEKIFYVLLVLYSMLSFVQVGTIHFIAIIVFIWKGKGEEGGGGEVRILSCNLIDKDLY